MRSRDNGTKVGQRRRLLRASEVKRREHNRLIIIGYHAKSYYKITQHL